MIKLKNHQICICVCMHACSMYVISALEIHILITICYYDKNLRTLKKKKKNLGIKNKNKCRYKEYSLYVYNKINR